MGTEKSVVEMKKLVLIIGILIFLPLSPVYALQDGYEQTVTNTAAVWDSMNFEQKVGTITELIGMHKDSGVVIQKEPEFYVEEIAAIRLENPEMYVKGIGNVFTALAIMYRDFDDGQDINELIEQVLSNEDYGRYVLNQSSTKFEDRYKEWKLRGVFKIQEDGTDYTYDESFKDFEKTIEADLDGDGKDETIWSFAAKSDDEVSFHLCVTIIYKTVEGKRLIVKTIVNGEHPKELYAADFDNDGVNELVLMTHAGMHWTEVNVYQYKDNDYVSIFSDETASGVVFVEDAKQPLIKVGRPGGKAEWSYADEPLWKVYKWGEKGFEISKDLSSPKLKYYYPEDWEEN